MKIIILGSNGLVGREVSKYLSKKHDIIKSDIDTLDLKNSKSAELFFKKNKADVLINLFGKNEHVSSISNNLKTVNNIKEDEIRDYFEVNTILLFRVCRYFTKYNLEGKVFNFSSLSFW